MIDAIEFGKENLPDFDGSLFGDGLLLRGRCAPDFLLDEFASEWSAAMPASGFFAITVRKARAEASGVRRPPTANTRSASAGRTPTGPIGTPPTWWRSELERNSPREREELE